LTASPCLAQYGSPAKRRDEGGEDAEVHEEGQLPSRSRWVEEDDDRPKASAGSKQRSKTNGHGDGLASSPGEVSQSKEDDALSLTSPPPPCPSLRVVSSKYQATEVTKPGVPPAAD